MNDARPTANATADNINAAGASTGRASAAGGSTGVLWGDYLAPLVLGGVAALVQFWAAREVIARLIAGQLADGVQYLGQALAFQHPYLKRDTFFSYLLEWGLYPLFLSRFDLQGVEPAVALTTAPKLHAVYIGQAVLLAVSTMLFIFVVCRYASGGRWSRALVAAACALLLVSPLVVIWPAAILNETIVLSALLLLMLSCVIYDAGRSWALPLIAVTCCLAVFARDVLIFFVWGFALLLAINLVLAGAGRRALAIAALVLLVAGCALAYARTQFIKYDARYAQTLANVIQMRILPDPERRAFFIAHGMPTPLIVSERAGQPAWVDNLMFAPEAEVPEDFRAYRRWIFTRGIRTYASFVLSHPHYVWRSLFESPSAPSGIGDVGFAFVELFAVPGKTYAVDNAPYPERLRNFLLAPFGWVLSMVYFLVAACGFVWRSVNRQPASAVEVAGLAGFGGLFFAYHADAWDLWRHAVPFLVVIYLSMILRAPVLLGQAFAWARRRIGGQARLLNPPPSEADAP